MPIPKKVADRLAAGLKRVQTGLEAAKDRDLSESDTSMIVTGMLAEVFGFDKYSEATREYAEGESIKERPANGTSATVVVLMSHS